MLIRESDESLFAKAEFSGVKASLISDKLQQMAFVLAWAGAPTSTTEQTNLTLPDGSSVSTIHSTNQGDKAPRRVLKIKGPNTSNVTWQTSSDGQLWRAVRSFGSVSGKAFNEVVRPLVDTSGLYEDKSSGLNMAEVFKAPANEAFDLLASWARHIDGATFTTETAYEDNREGSIGRIFTVKTTNSHNKSEVARKLEVSDSRMIGQAIVYRTVRIGSLQKTNYRNETRKSNTYAGVLLESEAMARDELATAAQDIHLDNSAAISAYIQSSMQSK